MTYPVDDLGNVRVDFVWGHMPAQPDQQREGRSVTYTTDGNWTVKPEVGSDTLRTGYEYVTRNTGDGWQNEINRERPELITYGSADIPTTGWANYPAFLPNYGGDGDTALEILIPNLANLTISAAQASVEAAGLVFNLLTSSTGATADNNGKFKAQSPASQTAVNPGSTVDVTYFEYMVAIPDIVGLTVLAAQAALNAVGLEVGNNQYSQVGATSGNNQTIKSQSPISGTLVTPGSLVDIQVYQYVAPVNYNIAGIRSAGSDVNYRFLYLQGRNSGIQVGNQITLHDTGVVNYNRPFDVTAVVNDDAFNTGGQKITIRNGIMDGTGGDVTNTGTYTKP